MGRRMVMSKACPVMHEMTYILLMVIIVPRVRHLEMIHWGCRVWPGKDIFVDPEGDAYIGEAFTREAVSRHKAQIS